MLYSIAKFAKYMNITPHTLRFYEKEQLIIPNRQINGHRYYTEQDATWLNFVIKLKSTGMPLKQIQQYALMRKKGDSTLQQRMDMLSLHRQFVQKKQDEWQENLLRLDNKITHYQQLIEKQNKI